jgi:AbrB family looped-hinge helix DNA binding protein
MKTTIDSAGRLVIPKEIRRRAGLAPGVPLEVRYRDGVIEIEPAPMKVKLVREGRFLVAVPLEDVPPLTTAEVEATRQAIYEERERDLMR